jgi:sugar phosphate isomerase/epimerase
MKETVMIHDHSRRDFLRTSVSIGLGATLATTPLGLWAADDEPLFRISLAEWSLHRTLSDNKLSNMEFAKYTKEQFGIEAVEYVNQFFKDKADDKDYLQRLKQQAEDHSVQSLLIMIDNEGDLGDPDDAKRKVAVENHYKWVEAAKFLGCHSIRVNARSKGSYEEQLKLAAAGLHDLSHFAEDFDISVIVENHGGLSSNGKWLAAVIQEVGHDNCGTLPDFGNFQVARGEWYDRYQGVQELMPFAKAVSAKSHDFDNAGDETATDYFKMMKIVLAAGYRGYVGIEYEGSRLSEPEGIRATLQLLHRVREKLSAG